jgi:hypothetical protein
MHVPARSLCQPVADQRRLMGCVIVHDEMDVQIVGNSGFDLIEKLAELCGPMVSIALADDPASCDIEGGPLRSAYPRSCAVHRIAARHAVRPSDLRRNVGATCRRSLHPVPALLLPPCSAGLPRRPAQSEPASLSPVPSCAAPPTTSAQTAPDRSGSKVSIVALPSPNLIACFRQNLAEQRESIMSRTSDSGH